MAGSSFTPLLARLLPYTNNRRGWVQGLRYGPLANSLLLASLLVFGLLLAEKLAEAWQSTPLQ